MGTTPFDEKDLLKSKSFLFSNDIIYIWKYGKLA